MEMDAEPNQENQYQTPISVRPDIVVKNVRRQPETSETSDGLGMSEISQPIGSEFEWIEFQPRRSVRIPTLSAKALQNLQYED